uniref:ORF6N domain-containing protein n=1 Tax=Bacteroides clarus TaxID=626929 RepID=UPI003FEDF1EF
MEIAVIQNKIYEIRGQKVMIDRDLAEMYGVQTKALNQAVKRNIERFPEDFMFQLTTEETQNWKSQIVTTNSIKMGLRRNPYAFTELGVAMLSSVLTSKIAIQVNIGIMRAFVAVRQYLLSANNPTQEIEDLKQRVKELEESSEDTLAAINDLSEDTRKELDDIYLALTELAEKKKKLPNCNKIGYVAIQERRNEKQKTATPYKIL